MAETKAFKKLRIKARRKFWNNYTGPLNCYHCGNPVSRFMIDADPLLATVDHIIPLALGGKSDYNNLVLSCWKCNQLKSNK